MGEEELWKKLWKIKVVPKVRTFWWRVLKGFMPDYATLSRRHIKEESIYEICKSTTEDVKHALIECSHAKLFWEAVKEILNLKLPRLHQDTWTKDIICDSIISEEDRPKIITIMYSIWDSRNKWTHGEKGYNPVSTIGFVRDTLLCLDLPPPQRPLPRRPECRWQAEGVIKMNSDGAFAVTERAAVGGGIARDNGGFKGAWCKVYQAMSDPLTIEALALRDAVVFASEKNG
jgi:hypothetical protein